uniref:Uncharacterized protein n=1 Tax=Picea sitchensis TaxID=3332 RepID=A9NRL6_PICSI|nr:unknown [Picea sitchensis]
MGECTPALCSRRQSKDVCCSSRSCGVSCGSNRARASWRRHGGFAETETQDWESCITS